MAPALGFSVVHEGAVLIIAVAARQAASAVLVSEAILALLCPRGFVPLCKAVATTSFVIATDTALDVVVSRSRLARCLRSGGCALALCALALCLLSGGLANLADRTFAQPCQVQPQVRGQHLNVLLDSALGHLRRLKEVSGLAHAAS